MLRIVRAVVLMATGLAGAIGGIGTAAFDSTTAVAQERPTSKSKVGKAAKAKSSEPAAASPGADAEEALDKARRALAEGKTDTAVGLADSVLVSTSKNARNTARALAVRGEGRLKQGRTAEAIADLENALWVKGGVAGAERESAVAARAQALQQAGLAASPPPSVSAGAPAASGSSAPSQAKASAGKAATVAPPPAAEASVSEPLRPWDSSVPQVQRPRPSASATDRGTVVAAVPAEPRVQAAPSRPAAVVAPVAAPTRAPPPPPPPFSTQTQAAPAPAYVPPPVAAAPAPRPEPPKPAAAESSGGIGSFFGGLFGGGSQKAADETPQTTATVARPRPVQPSVSSSPPQRGDDGYAARSAETGVRPVRAASVVAPPPKAVTPPPSAPPAAATPEGASGYKIQLAAVRSKEEAQAMAQSVRKDEAVLGSRDYEIVEDVYGNMGRFYRVRISGFAPTEAMAVCTTLRRKQLDCMVLDR